MSKASPLTAILVLLVLVPAGVLAWLAFASTDAFDAAETAALRRDMDRARDASKVEFEAAVADQTQLLSRRLSEDGRRLAASLPMLTSDEAERRRRSIEDMLAIEYPGPVDVRIVDAQGRSILPVLFTADDGPGASDVPTQATLLDHLRREADRAWFGGGGLEAALDVWSKARGSFHTDLLRAQADLEQARLRAREDATGATAAAELAALVEAWRNPLIDRLGRSYVLLVLQAAPGSATARNRLRWLAERGSLASTPLTAEERRRALREAYAVHPRRGRGPTAAAERASVLFHAALDAGARLEVRLAPEGLRRRLQRHATPTGEHPEVARWVQGDEPLDDLTAARASGLPVTEQLAVVLPGDVPAVVHLVHRAWRDTLSRRKTRGVLILVGVACLCLVIAMGLLLTRRAVAREREARRIRDDFIANVTHEVRTPLTSVLLHTEMLADEATPAAKRRAHADVVQAQGRRLAALVNDMLDFAALERGTRTLESAPVDLGAACREAVAPFLVLAEREGLVASCEIAGKEVAALADPAALARILGNLVGNAWKHGRPARDGGPGRIRILARDDAQGGVVEVRDDGPGIPAEERERVFERFGRGRGAVRKEGSGIGLSLSRDLARAMDGDLSVHEDGLETVFRLRLPPVPDLESDA